jgi:hypothetical protein
MSDSTDIRDPTREQRIRAYLSGAMSESDAEAFERELFLDDELAAEVERALEIKASVGSADRPSVITRLPPRSRREFRWIAIAAVFSAVAIGGVLWLTRMAQEPMIMRAGEERLSVQLAPGTDGMRLSWSPVANATAYRVDVFTQSGEKLSSREIPDLSLVVGDDVIGGGAAGAVFARVIAIDHLRREIADSGLIRIAAGP